MRSDFSYNKHVFISEVDLYFFNACTVYNCTAEIANIKPHRLRVNLEKHICTEPTVADIDRLPTETTLGEANFQLSIYDDLSRLAKVCIVHGVGPVRALTKIQVIVLILSPLYGDEIHRVEPWV